MRWTVIAAAAIACAQPPAEPSLAGIAVNAVTGEPLRKTFIRLGQGKRPEMLTMTNAEGRFRFDNLPKGDYWLKAERNGFAQRNLTVAIPDPAVLRVKLEPLAAIHGRVTDDEGDPLPGVSVRVLRDESAFGRHYLDVVKTVDAASDGSYRADDLPAGRYLVHASSSATSEDRVPRASFYPGVPLPAQASVIHAAAGNRLDATDIRLPWKPAYTVRGRIETPDKAAFKVHLQHDFGGYSATWNSRDATLEGETFQFRNVSEGDYWIEATSVSSTDGRHGARPLSIGSDPGVVRITPVPLPSLEVRLRKESEECTAPQWMLLPLSNSAEPASIQPGTLARMKPGDYRAILTESILGSSACYVTEVHFNGQAVMGTITIAGDGVWEAVLAPGAGSVEGLVLNFEGKPASGAQVVLMPERSEPRWPFFLSSSAGARGGFVFENVPPGEYRVFAREHGLPDQWEDLDPLKERATRVRVEAKRRSRTILRVD